MSTPRISITDNIETLILMALDANHGQAVVDTKRDDIRGGRLELHDQGELLALDEMRPTSAYTFDATDSDRMFATTTDYLITHPADVLGDESEVIMLNGATLKWYGIRKLQRAPKGVAVLGRASHWYEMHYRYMCPNGAGEYYKRIVPIDRHGTPLLARVQGHNVCVPQMEGEQLVLCASVIEDAHRSNTMLAAVKDGAEIKFPVPLGDYKDVFADRDGPMNGARRKAIVHWVAAHLRQSATGKPHPVQRHIRGVQEFVIDGLRIRLTPNGD